MGEKLRIGVLGSGGGPGVVGTSRGTYLGSLAERTDLMETVAVCGVDPDHVAFGASRMRNAEAFTDVDRFLSYGLDAVIIASPLSLHAGQSIAVLERGLAVLSEVTPVSSLTQAAQLAAAVERTNGFYMLAENYRFIDDIELVKRMVDDGRFGRVSFGEGEYLHDCRDLALNADGTLTWRGDRTHRGGLYCTHSLIPLLYITGDRVATVSCLEADGGIGGTIMLMKSVGGRVFKVRLDSTSPRPHNMAYYAVQGESGAYESWRGMGDQAKVWLADAHEPSQCRALNGEVIAQWHPLSDFAAHYIPERVAAPEVARSSGHFGADYWMLTAFARALLDGQRSPIDVYQALDCCVPGIVALASKANGGAPVPVPDFRPRDGRVESVGTPLQRSAALVS
jgi:predicted dehydrogenase